MTEVAKLALEGVTTTFPTPGGPFLALAPVSLRKSGSRRTSSKPAWSGEAPRKALKRRMARM